MSKPSARRVAAAIPAYQAAPSVGDIARRTLQILEHVVVIDDGSSDDTSEAAKATGARVLRLPSNQGKGRALRAAFELLFGEGHEAVVTLDADGQHLPEEIPKLLAAWDGGGDLVLGTRDHLFASMAAVRRLANRLSSRAISTVAGLPLDDIQTGFRLYSADLIRSTGFPEPRFEAESAVVVRAVRHGFRVVSVAVNLGFADGRLTSHFRPLVDSLRIASAVTRARLEGDR